MRLVTVRPEPRFTYTCYQCKRKGVTDPDGWSVYADTEGEPWKAYYCTPCAKNTGAKLESGYWES